MAGGRSRTSLLLPLLFSAVSCELMPILEQPPSCWRLYDEDGDGFAGPGCAEGCGAEHCTPVDCDDTSRSVNPGPSALELPANEVDEDCDGYLLDRDGDGHESWDHGGDDCDDEDAARWLMDGDGDLHVDWRCGGDDCNDQDPLRWTSDPGVAGSADADGDGFVDERCCGEGGCGDDCDDDCPDCRPGDEVTCGAAYPFSSFPVDGNCDGVVDNLLECSFRQCLSDSDCGVVEADDGEGVPAWRIVRHLDTGSSRSLIVQTSYTTYDFIHSIVVAADSGLRRVLGFKTDDFSLGISYFAERQWEEWDWVDGISALAVANYDSYYFVSDGEWLFSFSNTGRTNELELRHLPVRAEAVALAASGRYVYAASLSGLSVYDFRDPSIMRLADGLELTWVRDVFVYRGQAFLAVRGYRQAGEGDASTSYGLLVLDRPTEGGLDGGSEPVMLGENWANAVFVADERVFLATDGGAEGVGLEIYSLDDLALTSSVYGMGHCNDVFVLGRFAYVATDGGLFLVDVAAETPRPVAQIALRRPGVEGGPASRAWAVQALRTSHSVPAVGDEWYAFVAAEDGLYIIELGEPEP